MNLKEIRHIIWDWNGTLVDDAQLCVDLMNGIRSKRSLPSISLESYRDTFDFPVIEYYKRIGFDFEIESFASLSDEFINEYVNSRKSLLLHSGALAALKFFRERNLPQCVLSATQIKALKQTLREHRIEHYFKTVLGLDDHYADGKVHLGNTWLNKNHIEKEHVLFIGDTLHDLNVANQMGIHCQLIATGHNSINRLTASHTKVLRSLHELLTLFS